MSIIHEKSPKHCAEKLKSQKLEKKKKKLIFFYVFTFLLSILSLMLITWFILHPRNPSFFLKQANYLINSSSIHITLLSTNPNNNVGIYYDGLRSFLVHASYNGHASLPSFYQHHKETKLLINASLPLPPPPAPTGKHVQPTGEVALKVTGRLRWKVGTWVSRRYTFNVDCAALMPFPLVNVSSTPLITSKHPTLCSTSISIL